MTTTATAAAAAPRRATPARVAMTALPLALALALTLAPADAGAQDNERENMFGAWSAYSSISAIGPVYGAESESTAGPPAALHFMCITGRMNVTISWVDRVLDSPAAVRITVDGRPSIDLWTRPPGTARHLRAMVEHPRARDLALLLEGGTQPVTARVLTADRAELVTTFSLDGFRTAMTPLMRACRR